MKKGRKVQARLDARRHEYHRMIGQQKIADGHRGSDGYRCPGSNKK
jgi:hypothetical protein